ncbi:hypothetical protein ABPG74_002368 [Tetrahymena malaccensis]
MRDKNSSIKNSLQNGRFEQQDIHDILRERIAQSYFYNRLKTEELRQTLVDKQQTNQKLQKYFLNLTKTVDLPPGLSNQCIGEITKPFTNHRLNFNSQVNEFRMNVKKQFLTQYLSFESQLYELLNNALNLLAQNLDNEQLVLTYFELVVITIQKICNENFYILIYEICKAVDKMIKKMPVVIKETKKFDALMMMYFYYRGFSQINFDAKHKFYDYTMCKQYFFKLNYKEYLHVDPKFILKNMDDSEHFDFSHDDLEKQSNLYELFTSFQQKISQNSIKKQVKDSKKKEQMNGIELGFIDFFFQCYILFRDVKKNFKDVRHNLLKQTLNVYTKNQKFDLGVSQIHKCFFFLQDMQECQNFQKRCLRVVRQVMKKEQLIPSSSKVSEETIFEKFDEITDQVKLSIQQITKEAKNKIPLLVKYLKQLAEIHIYSKNAIGFLNLYRCLSILSESYYFKYLLYLEQLKWKAYEQCQDERYDILVKEIEEDLQNKNQTKKLFWKLGYQKMKESVISKQIDYLDINLKQDQPILHIRKIMNNIFVQIQKQKAEDIFTLLFNLDYKKFIEKWESHCENKKLKNGNDINITAYTNSLRFQNQLVFVKMYSLKGYQKANEIEFSYLDYFFVQEVAIAIYLREKQHQKYQSFHESIGYNCFNRYIYHFIQDNKIFLILEYYPILYQDIFGEGHFNFQKSQQNEIKQDQKPASSLDNQREQQPNSISNGIENSKNSISSKSSDNQEERNLKQDHNESSSIQSKSTQSQDTNDQSTLENIQNQQRNPTNTTPVQNLQNMKDRKYLKFTQKNLFSIMLRSEQAAYMLKENCIIHKDLKLLNIAMRQNGEIVFIDFGISELFLEFSYCMDNSGTKLYRSYQQATSQPISENTDLSALIIVMYELIIGKKINLENSGTDNYSAYISKYASKEINFMFSKDFIKLIEMICDSQLDTVKSRTKFFMWQKFEIFMNLLYDCLEKNSQIEYQKYYQQVKKAIINIAVKRKKPKLEVKFNFELLKNLMHDEIFLMLVSLQSNNILKMYESLLFIAIKEIRMQSYQKVKKQIGEKINLSKEHLSILKYNENQVYKLLQNHLNIDNNEAQYDQNTLSYILYACSDQCSITNLQSYKFKFNKIFLDEQFQIMMKKQITEFDDSFKYFLINIFQKIYKYTIYQEIIDELTNYMDNLEKLINQFQQNTCEQIKSAYQKTDSIKQQIEKKIDQYKNTQNLSQEMDNLEIQNINDYFEQQYIQNTSNNFLTLLSSQQNSATNIQRGQFLDQNCSTKQFNENLTDTDIQSTPSTYDLVFNYSNHNLIEGEKTKRGQTQNRDTMQKQNDIQQNKDSYVTLKS